VWRCRPQRTSLEKRQYNPDKEERTPGASDVLIRYGVPPWNAAWTHLFQQKIRVRSQTRRWRPQRAAPAHSQAGAAGRRSLLQARSSSFRQAQHTVMEVHHFPLLSMCRPHTGIVAAAFLSAQRWSTRAAHRVPPRSSGARVQSPLHDTLGSGQGQQWAVLSSRSTPVLCDPEGTGCNNRIQPAVSWTPNNERRRAKTAPHASTVPGGVHTTRTACQAMVRLDPIPPQGLLWVQLLTLDGAINVLHALLAPRLCGFGFP